MFASSNGRHNNPPKECSLGNRTSTSSEPRVASYVVNGIKHGFRVGYDHSKTLRNCTDNMISARQHPDVVSDYLTQEVLLNRMVVIPPEQVPYIHCHISPFGVIPKRGKPGKWRLIVDLSSPHNASVNDGIDKDMCSISYTTVDQIVEVLLSLGRGALMAKADIKQAYRIVPVHPDDRHLLSVQWEGQVLVDKVLPFGLRSAPLIFTALADALQWIMTRRGVYPVFHYLDDFITLGTPDSLHCQHNLAGIMNTCKDTGVPLEEEKCEGPAQVITFLGMELDSIKMEIRLPVDKLERLRTLLMDWKGRKAGTKRELLSLIGVLHHASKAVRQGRSFIRRLITLSTVVKKLDNFVRLNISARSDILWWSVFASQWNGTSMLVQFDRANPQVMVTSDASGTWGCGAYESGRWLQFKWPPNMKASHISVREMIPVVMSAALWGRHWLGKSVCFRSDNSAVVALVNSGCSRDHSLMHLMRCLAFITAKYNFVVSSAHIKGAHNDLADALSRNNKAYFLSCYPQAQASPTTVPQELVELLVTTQPDWISPHWTRLWTAIFSQH